MISCYIFDLDGTLLDTEILWVEATQNYLVAKGCSITHEESMKLVYGRSWTDVHADIVARFPELAMGVVEMQVDMDPYFYEIRDTVDIRIHGSIELLKRLSKTTPCCIVSGSPRQHIGEAIELMGVQEHVDFYLGASDYPFGKPNPAGFLMAADRLGIPPAQCVVFEDSNVGVRAGKNAGMRVVALSLPNHPVQDIGMADLILPDLAEFNPAVFEEA